jgi:ribosomal protein S18 acetylase RimI-like enzyme
MVVGIAHKLHDELLKQRSEERATLLVEADNETAYRAYKSWGWAAVGRLHPGWEDAPWFDVLIRPLPVEPA